MSAMVLITAGRERENGAASLVTVCVVCNIDDLMITLSQTRHNSPQTTIM